MGSHHVVCGPLGINLKHSGNPLTFYLPPQVRRTLNCLHILEDKLRCDPAQSMQSHRLFATLRWLTVADSQFKGGNLLQI